MDLGLRRRDFALAGEMMGTQRVGKDVLDQIIQTVHMLFRRHIAIASWR